VSVTDVYSGALTSFGVYDDPRVLKTAYGPVSKRIAEATWPRARFTQDRVANTVPADTELAQGLRGKVSMKEALANAAAYLNKQESQALERLGQ
jgi:hypothetical protein